MRKRKRALCWYYIVFGQGCQGVRGRVCIFLGVGGFFERMESDFFLFLRRYKRAAEASQGKFWGWVQDFGGCKVVGEP